MSIAPREDKKRFLVGCLIVKDEARYLLEWIAFHRVVGFDYFYIYDNDSKDGTEKLLKKLDNKGVCKYIPWPRSNFPDNPQVHAYRHAIMSFAKEITWMAIVDADEFVVPLTGARADAILRDHFDHAAAVLCNWRVFGSSGLKHDDGSLCIDRFQKRAEDGYHSNNHIKSIIRPDLVETAFVHNHYMRVGPVVLSDGARMAPERDQKTSAPVYKHLQINHYYCKSLDEFMKKRSKGLAEYPLDHPTAIRPMAMFLDADRNEVIDTYVSRFREDVVLEYRALQNICGQDG